ncbi:MAG TPA: delta(1)-pyrroline-2-carboxylate reductase family protein [Methylibium sp.]|uniref:delta(1)-pyrroline-2-carboxylate reductase family protein n=1 Tax=Methylibium sp. TaxID=2067992 RepID=UPI002DBFFDA3|nr:delta(1)-pyrroline-2-carboxylate reductase family protein [Methylibium sp.]HEU4460011.1 delta(1)-pyrroline-2-carboxylate reductase family protein [Methylibium sp.]
MQVFDAAATRALLPAAPLVEAVAAAMRARRAGTLHAPERLALPLPEGASWLAMPAADATLAIAKLVAVHPANRGRGLPTIHGQVLVCDARDGRALALLDGPTVTARRTAAVTALGLRTLGRRPPRSIALIGCGAQALEHARLLAELEPIERLHLVGRRREQADALAARLAVEVPRLRVEVASGVAGAVDRVDAAIALTTSLAPVLPAELPEDLLVVGVGAFRPQMAELPPSLLHARAVIVDALDGARGEAGDLIQAGIDWSRVSELVDHLGAAAPAGPAPVFKTVGQAAWDLAAAHVACRRLAAPC